MMGRLLRWKRGVLGSGSGSMAAWIREFRHVSASLDIAFLICKTKTLDRSIFSQTYVFSFLK